MFPERNWPGQAGLDCRVHLGCLSEVLRQAHRHRRECGDARCRIRRGRADLRAGRLEDPLPGGNFDLVVSALAVHHLDGAGKADLFAPSRPVTGGADGTCSAMPWYPTIRPPSLHLSTACTTQVRWLAAVGLDAEVVWARQDLAVIVADSPS
jgi:tRNA (cmo5U34)-methyltransferase